MNMVMSLNKKIGIIDLGSNSVRLVIYEISTTGAFRLVDDISDSVRLSENMTGGKLLNEAAMKRAIKTVKLFRKLCNHYGIPSGDILAVATEAVRKAENKDIFLEQLYKATELSFKVLTGQEEAAYDFNAVKHSLALEHGIIIDIGGGSTEIIQFQNNCIVHSVSIPIGAVVATQEFLNRNIATPEMLIRLDKHVRKLLAPQMDWLAGNRENTVIGLGGSIRNLSKIHRKRTAYPLDIVHNYRFGMEDFHTIFHEIKHISLEDRRKVKGLAPKRADIIIGGLAIFHTICSIFTPTQIVISGKGLREGVLYEHLAHNKATRPFQDVLTYSLENYMDLHRVRRQHVEHVCTLALSMFDQLSSIHHMSHQGRKLLRIASLLHDIGISVNYYDHHSHSFYTILHSMLDGLTHRELLLTAAIAGSHGYDKLKVDLEKEYKPLLLPGDIHMVRMLSTLLKVAESLDRSETGVVRGVECHVDSKKVSLHALVSGDAELEISVANERTDMFKKVFRKRLIVY